MKDVKKVSWKLQQNFDEKSVSEFFVGEAGDRPVI